MKLQFEQPFTLEVGEDTYEASFRDLTKAEEKKINKSFSQKKQQSKQLNKYMNKLKKLRRSIEIDEKLEKWTEIKDSEAEVTQVEADMEALTDKIESGNTIDEMFMTRLELSVVGGDRDKILAIATEYGAERVFKTIMEDLSERKEGK